LTNKYERLRNPTFGGNIRRYLFEDVNDITAYEIKSDIEYLIKEYEPRVRLIEVRVDPSENNNAMNVFIRFGVFSFTEDTSLDIQLYRVR
jgi:phage baseplate assembly protein W